MDQPEIRFARTSDDVSIAYIVLGQGDPLVVTPFHGFSHVGMELENAAQRAILDRLATSFRVIRYDRRSTGMSQRRIGFDADTEQLDLEAVVDAVTGEAIVLLGRGFAGPAAIRYATQHPDRVSRLILYDTAVSTKQIEVEPMNVAGSAVSVALRHDRASMNRILTQMTVLPDPEWFEAFVAASCDLDHFDYSLGNDASEVASEVTVPVLVIAERFPDQNIERSTDLCARFSGAKLIVIDRWKGDPWPDWIDIADHVYRFLGLVPPPAAPLQAHVVTGGLRTVLFTDIVGHTEMMQRLGDAKGRDVLREHERITRETLKAHGGAEVKTMGDGFMASFGSVTSAVECAISLQRAFATHTESNSEPLHVRVGLNAGEPIEEDGDLFGATVILASRIAAKAGAGEILVPDTVRGLLSGKGFVFGDRGEFVPKGFDVAVRLYSVQVPGLSPVRPSSPSTPAPPEAVAATMALDTAPPTTFAGGRYTVRGILGEGGQKLVYLVHDASLDRECALSVLKTELSEPDDLARIRREAQAMARLQAHTNIVTVYDLGEEDGRPFIVCEYVPRGDLQSELRSAAGPLALPRALSIAVDVCRALAVAHARGIVHRDVKAANIWLSEDGSAKLGDFGIATNADATRLTMTGTVLGSANNMSPEQAQGEPLDARSDLYAVGCLLYELVVGQPPFVGREPLAIVSQHVHAKPPSPRGQNNQVPKAVDALILRLLAKDREQRPESAAAVAKELRTIRDDLPPNGASKK